MGKIIGLTYDLKEDWVFHDDDPPDANAELDRPETIERIKTAFEKGGHKVKKIGNVQKLLAQIDKRLGVDIVFNICEGRRGRNRESQVPNILEMYNVPFVGGDALTLGITLDKVAAKKCFIADGVPTPGYFSPENADDLEGLKKVKFPLIVKTRHEGTSKGITKYSRVENVKDLKKQIALITSTYKQPALVEEFIRGSEFTVAVIGTRNPHAMPVAQVCVDGKANLGDEFYSTERIKAPDTIQYVCPADISKALTKKLQDIAIKAYKSVDCRDFGRIDFRVDEKGNPYVLEINPLPSLAAADVFNLFPPAIGSNFEDVLNQILNFALERYGMLEKDAPTLVLAR
jgi:D-alanine-D-alanine ligase